MSKLKIKCRQAGRRVSIGGCSSGDSYTYTYDVAVVMCASSFIIYQSQNGSSIGSGIEWEVGQRLLPWLAHWTLARWNKDKYI